MQETYKLRLTGANVMNTKAKAIAHRLIGHAFTLMPAAIAAYAVVGLGTPTPVLIIAS
jgi:hypothetical protein